MCKQLPLFPELVIERLVSNLDERIEEYIKDIPEEFKDVVSKSFRSGALMVLGDIIDLLKNYIDLHES